MINKRINKGIQGSDLIFLGSKIIADGDCSHEIKRHLLLGRKAIDRKSTRLNSSHTQKSRMPSSA